MVNNGGNPTVSAIFENGGRNTIARLGGQQVSALEKLFLFFVVAGKIS
jgi:hypothetical protein